MSSSTTTIYAQYPHLTPSRPLIAAAPMRLITTAPLACATSLAGGLGFLGAGSDASTLESMLEGSRNTLNGHKSSTGYTWALQSQDAMPVGVGFLMWGIDDAVLDDSIIPLFKRYRPCAVWLFAPRGSLSSSPEQSVEDMEERHTWLLQMRYWTSQLRKECPETRIWLQVSSVIEATTAMADSTIGPSINTLVVQGSDAGGHGLVRCAGLISLLPEVVDAIGTADWKEMPYIIAAGGLSTGTQVASAMVLGAQGAVLGTRLLACPEVNVAQGYQSEVVRASDGGQSTVRSGVYDWLRGTRAWPKGYGGRGVVNASYEDWMEQKLGPGAGDGVHKLSRDSVDADMQKRREELQGLYKDAEKKAQAVDKGAWGPQGRLTTYAGTGVGLVKKVMPAREIVEEVQEECHQTLTRLSRDVSKL